LSKQNGRGPYEFRLRNGGGNGGTAQPLAAVMTEEPPPAKTGTATSWAVHLFTASGVVLALLALDAVDEARWLDAFRWLFAALVVDGIDGSFARAARVQERLPRIDGAVLDLVIDYLTFVLIPALIIWRAGFVPDSLGLPLAALILVSSLYVFARRDMKTSDGYFRGFPGLWNVVALYFVLLTPAPLTAAAIVIAFVILTFAPVHVPHPFRVHQFGRWLPILAVVWALSTAALLVPGLSDTVRDLLLAVSLATTAAMAGMGLYRTMRGDRTSETAGR
jgi:phosphatidylcholine synthase